MSEAGRRDELRTCLVTGSYPPAHCGIGDYARHLRDALTPLCGQPWLLTTAGAEADDRTKTVTGWNRRGVREATKELATLAPALVHMQYPGKLYGHRPEPCLLPRLSRRRPWLTTLHEYRIAHPLRKVAVLSLALSSTGLIFPCASERNYLTRRFPKLRRRSCVIPVGGAIPVVEPGDREAWRGRFGFGPAALVACHFGIVQSNKGVEALLDAMAVAATRLPNLRLLMIADLLPKQSACHANLAERCSHPPLAGRVRWSGYLPAEEVSRVLSVCDLCVLPYTDGLSARRTTFVTAAQHGLPIITTRGPDTAADFAVADGREALLVDTPVDPKALAEAVCRAAESADLRQRLSARVTGLVRDRSWPAIAAATAACYRRALAGLPIGGEDTR